MNVDGPANVSLVCLCCRTSDRTPGAALGAQTLAPLIGRSVALFQSSQSL